MDTNAPELRILYRDDCLIAVRKPAGLLVHRSAIDRHERQFAMQLLRDQIGQRVYPVHRLDKPTSGVLLFALDPQIATRLSEQFAGRETEKRYLAVVRGYTAEAARIDYPLKELHDRMTDAKADRDKDAQEAVTDFRRLATIELPFSDGRHPTSRYSLIEALPRSGRKHQIRRHMKHIFHPIVGDTTHGDGRHNRLFREQLASHTLLLCAVELGFSHPCTDARIHIHSPLDEEFQRLVARFGWQDAIPPALPQ